MPCDPLNWFEPVVANDPVLIEEADPVFTVILNVLASPFVNVITLLVAEAVNKSDPVLVVPPPPGLFKA